MLRRIISRFTFSLLRMEPLPSYRFYDIAANLTSQQFTGQYHSKQVHPSDLPSIISRASKIGCDHLLIAAGNIEDAKKSYEICKQSDKFFMTIGVHPCRASQPFEQRYGGVEGYFTELEKVLGNVKGKLVAIGECGLDYDRLNYASKEQQLAIFPHHFALAQKYNLPMYLHNRNTDDDFFSLIRQNRHRFPTGVVHSFTGTLSQLKQIIELDLFVGINGCSLKTEENLQVLKSIPLDRIMFETDCPYCEIRASHAGSKLVKTKWEMKAKEKMVEGKLVKGRNEPCRIIEVLEVVAGVMGIGEKELAERAFENSVKMLTK